MRRLAALLLALWAWPVAAQERCAVEIVLALDVSRSVSDVEYRLQIDGLADAFRTEDVAAAIGALNGGVMATVVLWGDATQQAQVIDWTLLETRDDLAAFADGVTGAKRRFGYALTGLGAAMLYSDRLTRSNPRRCHRRVIDISGDGIWNDGPRPRDVWANGMSGDVTVNGLVILGADANPLPHYRDEVIGGPFAFVETAEDFEDYAEAILRKLLRELSPSLSMAEE